ncbi:MAG: hypothetical protein RLZZ628_1343 [Bacteroidota bacterium]|jgi:hypothetical protein
MRKKIIHSILTIIFLLSTQIIFAQCPMCKTAVESNLKNGGTSGAGLNVGILMLLIMPYALVGGIGYVWWKNRKEPIDIELEAAMTELN